eukprot:2643964-Amphidinium_carterae.1
MPLQQESALGLPHGQTPIDATANLQGEATDTHPRGLTSNVALVTLLHLCSLLAGGVSAMLNTSSFLAKTKSFQELE